MRISADELTERASLLRSLQSPCALCPRACGVDRDAGAVGFCGATSELMVASYGPHFGEERELVGRGGSGTVFFSHCGLRCSFCQNYDISHLGHGRVLSVSDLSDIMLRLEAMGCANVNLVTPTHYVPQVAAALAGAAALGLSLPVVYNCGGYESLEVLAPLEGAVDVYLPDAKFATRERADALCSAPDYPERMIAALMEMNRQVGAARVDADGVARGGLLIRHLVMPGALEESKRVFRLLADGVLPTARVNVMGQYRPCGDTVGAAGPLGRALTPGEYEEALQAARTAGLSVVV